MHVNQFWMHVVATKDTITSFVMNRKIVVTEKSIVDLISHNGFGKRVYNAKTDAKREAMVASVIFKEGTKLDEGKDSSAKDLSDRLRVWFKIIMGCIHHQSSRNSSNYINTIQKYMMFFLEKGFKLALPAFLFKFLMGSIRETRTGSTSKKGRFIPNGRLISDLLVENCLVDDLLINRLTEELIKDARKILRRKNLMSISLISKVLKPNIIHSKDDICGMRIPVDNFPIFTKIDPLEVLEYYLESYLKDGIYPIIDLFNLSETYPDVHGKKKKESREDESSRPLKKKNKVATFLDEDEVPLSECQKRNTFEGHVWCFPIVFQSFWHSYSW